MKAMIKLEQIIVDSALQPREHMSTDLVSDYAERIQEGDKFPPVVVVVDNEKSYLVDGFHRVAAYRQLEFIEVEAEVVPGSYHDAILRSAGANADHGQRRTNEDKRRAVLSLLADSQWSRKSDSWIAIQAKVSHMTVGRLRSSLEQSASAPIRETADGRTMDTTNIGGKKKPAAPPPPAPEYQRTRVGRPPEIEPEPEADPFEPTYEPPETGSPYLYPDVESAVAMLLDVLRIQQPKIDPAIWHEVINTALMRFRDISIDLHRKSIGRA